MRDPGDRTSRKATHRHRPTERPIHPGERDLLTRDAEDVEEGPLGVGAVEGVEVNSGDVVIEEVVALLQGEVSADAADQPAPGEGFAMELRSQKIRRAVDSGVAGIDAS
jgi:hypothetical protein